MELVDLVDLAGEDWSRRWVQLRALLLVVVLIVAPTTVIRGVEWYAQQKAATFSRQINHLPTVATVPPRHG